MSAKQLHSSGLTLRAVLDAERRMYAQFELNNWHTRKPVYFVDYQKPSPLVYCWNDGITYRTYCVFPIGRYFS